MRPMPMVSRLLVAAAAFAMAGGWSAPSQDAAPDAPVAQDWLLHRDPAQKLTLALAEFDNDLTLATRCRDNAFELFIAGLPSVQTPTRPLEIAYGDGPFYPGAWFVGGDREQAFSRMPAMDARLLARGGRLQVRVPAGDGMPARRYVMELSPSGAAIEETLTACGRALVDERRDGRAREALGVSEFSGVEWARRPRPNFPDPTRGRYAVRGSVTVSCLTLPTGGLHECLIESEYPAGFGFGEKVLSGMRRARVRNIDRSTPVAADVMIVYTTNFLMES